MPHVDLPTWKMELSVRPRYHILVCAPVLWAFTPLFVFLIPRAASRGAWALVILVLEGLMFALLGYCSLSGGNVVIGRRRRYEVVDGALVIRSTALSSVLVLFSVSLLAAGIAMLGEAAGLGLLAQRGERPPIYFLGMAIGVLGFAGYFLSGGLPIKEVRISPAGITSKNIRKRVHFAWDDIASLGPVAEPPNTPDRKIPVSEHLTLGVTRRDASAATSGAHPNAGDNSVILGGLDIDPNTLAYAIRTLHEHPDLRSHLTEIAPTLLAGPTERELRRMTAGDTWTGPSTPALRRS